MPQSSTQVLGALVEAVFVAFDVSLAVLLAWSWFPEHRREVITGFFIALGAVYTYHTKSYLKPRSAAGNSRSTLSTPAVGSRETDAHVVPRSRPTAAQARNKLDTARLALLLYYSHRASTGLRSSARHSGRTPAVESLLLAGCRLIQSSDSRSEPAMQRRQQLINMTLVLALCQLSHRDSKLATPIALTTLDTLTLSSGPDVNEGARLASAPSSPVPDLPLARRPRQPYPATSDQRPTLNVCIPASSVSFTSLPDDALPHAVELHKATRERDMFRQRAYQLAFKVDELHNRHSETLCALERAEAALAQLWRERIDLGVALASVVVRRAEPRRSKSSVARVSSLAPMSVKGATSVAGSVDFSTGPQADSFCHPLAISDSTAPSACSGGPLCVERTEAFAMAVSAAEDADDLVFYPRSASNSTTHLSKHTTTDQVDTESHTVLEPSETPLLPATTGDALEDTETPKHKRTATWAHSPRGHAVAESSTTEDPSASGVPPSSRAKLLLARIAQTWWRKPANDAETHRDHDGSGHAGPGPTGVRTTVDLASLRSETARPIFTAFPESVDSGDEDEQPYSADKGKGKGKCTLVTECDASDDGQDTAPPSPSPKRDTEADWIIEDLMASRLPTNKDKDAFRVDRSVVPQPLSKHERPAFPSASGTSRPSRDVSEQRSWRASATLRERMSSVNLGGATSGSLGFGRRRQTTAPPQTMENPSGSWRERGQTSSNVESRDPDADTRKQYAPYFQGQGAGPRGLRRVQSLDVPSPRRAVRDRLYANVSDRLRTRMTRSRGDADRNMFADSLWNARARAREAAEMAARGEGAQAVGA
ncbi:hypothetical protein C8Q76DRAFT_341441 [Earliella scabrosa]|nr:hypothetical protein C8Q76DRAFT_341441 [Earliella scabrosa]